ncbi:MAG: UDP-N-acetylmuramoyl-tripeptide--D-alanyl-D-alanine ligase [Gammaproteobacteria bacterium]|nr:UDP-N-acetylmuramoyl-tripeptide--D-alanyl-D-alanine ligase [Gammaproteobacteria bacterium]
MSPPRLSEAAAAIQASVTGEDVALSGFSIDTRTLVTGDMYIAIRGDRFDGHDFIEAAQSQGASALLVEHTVASDLPQLIVKDTRRALTQLAKFWAGVYPVPTVAITGSNGKTTIKEMISAILSKVGPVLYTQGNLNNDIGVPLTLLRLRAEHQFAVVEMGANHVGEIAGLTELVEPKVALISNIGPAHIEGFGSIDRVAAAKAEIFQGLTSAGYAVINDNDHFKDFLKEKANHAHIRTFGNQSHCSVSVSEDGTELQIGDRKVPLTLQLLGRHNAFNAAAAAAVADILGVEFNTIVSALEQVPAVPGRLEATQIAEGITVIDDSYNANPASTAMAIDVLKQFPSQRILILGDMLELGPEAEKLHQAVGHGAAADIDKLFSVGGKFCRLASDAHGRGEHFDSHEACLEQLQQQLTVGEATTLLVKGSRGSRMEKIVQGLKKMALTQPVAHVAGTPS